MNDGGKLQNGWRNLDGEAQLGFWGAVRILSTDVRQEIWIPERLSATNGLLIARLMDGNRVITTEKYLSIH